jgi:hypothetical protein
MRETVKRLFATAALVAGVALALPAHADEPGAAVDSGTVTVVDEAGAAMPVELLRGSDERGDPFGRARDYGRLLILLSVPAAFVGLHLHVSRRAQILPPS